MAYRNGRSYVVRGETPKRYWEPSQGDVVYIEGTKTRLGKPYQDPGDRDVMFPLRPAVRGTTDMSARNIKAIARVEEGKGMESVGSMATFSRRPNPEPVTPVIFRKFPASEGGEIIAIFPYDKADAEGNVSSYMTVGQHGAASPQLVGRTKLASSSQYADLKRELEGIGYRLRVIKKWPTAGAMRRILSHQNPGPSALPSKWTPATITRRGRQIQIRVGGRR